MRIKPLRSMIGTFGTLRRNVEVNLDEKYARDLIKKGRAVAVGADAAKAPAKGKSRAKKADTAKPSS